MAERTLTVKILGDASQLRREFDRASRSNNNFGRNLERGTRGAIAATVSYRGLGRAVGFASSSFLGGAGLVFAIKTASQAASDLNEQTNKSRVVFGQSSRAVEDFARNALLLSADQALEAAGTFGALLRPLGETESQAAKTSVGLVKLAEDLSSFHNADITDTLLSIRSGLVGEVEPLRKFGIRLSEARVQQEALKETGKKNVKALTDQEKVAARLVLIYKDSATAQGDAERTSGGLANQQRILEKNIRNLEAAVGTALNPTILNATKSLNAWLGNSENQARVQRDVTEAVQVGTAVVKDFAAVAGVASDSVGGLKNLIEILIGLKVASVIAGWVGNFKSLGKAAGKEGAAGEVGLLRRNMLLLRALGPVTAVVVLKQVGEAAGVNTDFSPKKLFSSFNPAKNKGPLLNFVLGNGWESDAAKQMREAGKKSGKAFMDGLKANSNLGFREFSQGLGFRDPTLLDALGDGKTPKAKKGISASQRNTIFDQMIGRREDRVQDIVALRGQVAAIDSIIATLRAEIAKVRDPTRKLTLTDELVREQRERKQILAQIVQDAKDAADQLAQNRLDAIGLIAERAQATKSLRDDLRAAQQMTAELLRQVAANKTNVQLQSQLFESQQNERSIRQQMRDAAQFRALGLGPTGGDLVPTKDWLTRRLGQIKDNVKGTFLDTNKTRNLLKNVTRLVTREFAGMSDDVKNTIRQMLDDIGEQLKDNPGRELTKFQKASTAKLVGGLGLTRAQSIALQGRLAAVGQNGTVPVGGFGAFGRQIAPANATVIIVHDPVFNGVQDVRSLKDELTKETKRSRTGQRRGPGSGRR